MPGGSDLDDARFDELLSAARAGAEHAWTQLYHELAPALLGYLHSQRLPDPEDVLGEVFLQVVRDLRQFDGDQAKFRSWVFTIAHHRMIDARRRIQRRPPTDPTPTEDLDVHLPPAEAEQQAMDRLTTGEVLALLDDLTGDQREVLVLRLIGGLTHAEVAEVLGKRLGAVKQLQRRALSALEGRLPE
ncbi:MAG TPA: RNA polymerase sigma factor [Nitriliruptorales bacterium]